MSEKELLQAILAQLQTQQTKLLDVNQVSAVCGLAVSTVWMMSRDEIEGFPRPVSVGVDLTRWKRSAIEKWIESRPVRRATAKGKSA